MAEYDAYEVMTGPATTRAALIGEVCSRAGIYPDPITTMAMMLASARIFVNCTPRMTRETFVIIAAIAYAQAAEETRLGLIVERDREPPV